jgi:hypothetical protein
MIKEYNNDSFGFIYISGKYLPEGMVDDNLEAE